MIIADPLNRLEAPTFSGEEPSDTPGTIVKLSWQVPKDDSVRALAVVLRINDVSSNAQALIEKYTLNVISCKNEGLNDMNMHW